MNDNKEVFVRLEDIRNKIQELADLNGASFKMKLSEFIGIVYSLQPVETLEDVLASLPLNFNLSRNSNGEYCIAVGDWDSDGNLHLPFEESETPLQAALALREKLNSK